MIRCSGNAVARRRQRRRLALLAMTLVLGLRAAASPALAWGAGAHSIVAEIAERLVAPQTRAEMRELLGDGGSFASWSNWADGIIDERPQTRTWHFVDIPYGSAGYDPARDCPGPDGGDCIVGAIRRQRAVLADRNAGPQARGEAARFLIHLVADAHQPLHCAERNGDNGGNTVEVTLRDRRTTLHKAWDFELLDVVTYDWGEHLRAVRRRGVFEEPPEDDPARWVADCHGLAVQIAYALPEGNTIDEAYEARARRTIYRQLGLAGIRLARLLDETLR